MNHDGIMAAIPVWALCSGTRELVRLNGISKQRRGGELTYTAQHDDLSTDWPNEVAAADWLQQMDGRSFDFVIIGRVFRPEWTAKDPKSRHALAR